ncbi:DUF397 domain-containing protein [Streptomyces sp. JJ36]|uniref:DUF397 domain-containing protein n=1 Tax=Streptomyces sp. JJ36 TaxID=2736645 RepID=UPI001F1AED59|nr:DUF397 domain-containing protein [Streptomyces sp. JJ36]MCF6526059.1 DUF397 domain-containing protein [Streptomyces sp. JJ36]
MTAERDWFKSSYSGSGGGNCLEVAVSWRKSSHSGPDGGNCIEIAACPGTVHVRDSKNVPGPELDVQPAAWAAFVEFAARD